MQPCKEIWNVRLWRLKHWQRIFGIFDASLMSLLSLVSLLSL
jgi:hypothetical protein